MRFKSKKSLKRSSKTLSMRLRGWVWLGCLAIVGLFGFFGLFGKNGLLEIFRLKTMRAQIEEENQKLLTERRSLEEEVTRLQDPKYLEYIAREELGMIGPQEYFILLDAPEESSNTNSNL